MTTLQLELAERREEFDAHFKLGEALEDRMILDASLGSINLTVRHVNTIKSGLIIHLYNIEEALMSQAMNLLGSALGSVDPRRWTEHSLREWLRESIVGRTVEGNEDCKLETVFQSSSLLLTQPILGPQTLKKPSGSWDDKLIHKFAVRMNVNFQLTPEIWIRIAPAPKYGDKSPMQFLAARRNAIAHGRLTFEDGAGDLSLVEIRELANITLDYLAVAAVAFQSHVENESHLVALP